MAADMTARSLAAMALKNNEGTDAVNFVRKFNTGNTYENEFIFDNEDTGIILLMSDINMNASMIKLKGNNLQTYQNIVINATEPMSYYKKYSDCIDGERFAILPINTGVLEIRKDTSKASGFTYSTGTYNYVTPTSSQIISGTKTFTINPMSIVAPTNDNHLVNKKYVDDKITELRNQLGL